MTDDELKELERLAEAAMPGPWRTHPQDRASRCVQMPFPSDLGDWVNTWTTTHQEAAFIAASRTAVPALIAALRAERARADRFAKLLGEALHGLNAGANAAMALWSWIESGDDAGDGTGWHVVEQRLRKTEADIAAALGKETVDVQ